MPPTTLQRSTLIGVLLLPLIPLGLLVLALATWGLVDAGTFSSRARETTGRVVSIDAHSRHGSIRVEFKTADGQLVTFLASRGNPEWDHLGERVDVLYDPAEPQAARVGSSLWSGPILGLAIGLGMLASGVAGVVVLKRSRRRATGT